MLQSMKIHDQIAWMTQDQIIDHLHSNRELMDDKKMHELVIGWLLTRFLAKTSEAEPLIGLPLVYDWEQRSHGEITLESLLSSHHHIVEDRDVDLHIAIDKRRYKCQITRFLNSKFSRKERRLIDLINQKCRSASPDKSIALVVSSESKPNITEEELMQLSDVPFGTIILISKATRERGHFICIQLHPKPVVLEPIRVPLLV